MKKILSALFVLVALLSPVSPVFDTQVAHAATDIKNDGTLSTSLANYWKLEEASGTRVDSHGSDDLTDNNTVTTATGIIDEGADFENTIRTRAEHLSNTSVRDGDTGDLSISLWAKFESFGPYSEYFAAKWKTAGNERGFQFYRNNEINRIDIDYSSDGSTSNRVAWRTDANVLPSTGTWYHVVVTIDVSAETSVIYVDGGSVAVTKFVDAGTATSIHDSAGTFMLGSQANDGQYHYFDGVMDEVGLWNKVLSSSEVTDLYNSGSGLVYDAGGGGGTARRVMIIN